MRLLAFALMYFLPLLHTGTASAERSERVTSAILSAVLGNNHSVGYLAIMLADQKEKMVSRHTSSQSINCSGTSDALMPVFSIRIILDGDGTSYIAKVELPSSFEFNKEEGSKEHIVIRNEDSRFGSVHYSKAARFNKAHTKILVYSSTDDRARIMTNLPAYRYVFPIAKSTLEQASEICAAKNDGVMLALAKKFNLLSDAQISTMKGK